MKKIPWILLPILVVAVLCVCLLIPRSEPRYSMFSWDDSVVAEENRKQLMDVIKKAGVNELYQEFSENQLQTGAAGSFSKELSRSHVKVYAVVGKPQWALEADGASLVREIEAIASANRLSGLENAIAGVVVDVEPYTLDEWDEGSTQRENLMRSYQNNMKEAYAVANANGLELLNCIPTFYNNTCPEVLEALVSQACDGIAVMNYNRENEYEQMKDEVELAAQHQKRVICIYELQKPGKHGLTDINTYYHTGLEVLHASRRTLQKRFNYDKLGFSYHYYKPLQELLGE